LPQMGQAQVFASNLTNTPTGNFGVANNLWVAQEFVWEGLTVNGVELTPDLILSSVQLQMDAASGEPGGFTVSIYTAGTSLHPGTILGTLSGESNPQTPGLYTYTTPGITLAPTTSYFVVVTGATPSSQGSYDWSTTTSSGIANNNLVINDVYDDSTDGLNWNATIRQSIAQMALFGTPVPEPSPWQLSICGTGLLYFVRRRKA
jgi:hypothetical protein